MMKHHYLINDETSLSDKDFFLQWVLFKRHYWHYIHAQKVFKELELKDLGDYHDVSARNDTLLLADVFENFRNKFIETNELAPAHEQKRHEQS